MRNKRMFSLDIADTDNFTDMPVSSQALYFHLGLRADDDGFIQPKRIVKALGFQEDDLRILITKGFLIAFGDGVVVITHWNKNNFIRKDRYEETIFKKEKQMLSIDKNQFYTVNLSDNQLVNQTSTTRVPRIEENRIEEKSIKGELPKVNYTQFIDLLNSITNRKFTYLDKKAKRQFYYLSENGISLENFGVVIRNAYAEDYHKQSKFKYLTPEFLTRPDKFEKFMQQEKQEFKREKTEAEKLEEFNQYLEN